MEKKSNHGGLISFEPTQNLNKWGFISKSWNGRIYPPFYHPDRIAELVNEWVPDERDIFICTHQKVGTHLAKKFVVELMRNLQLHPTDHGISSGDIGHGTVPWPEVTISQYGKAAFWEKLEKNQDFHRLWYTHCSLGDFPFQLENNKSKVIHVFRDPRGAVVSQFHFYRSHPMLGVSQDLDLDSFIDLFLEGTLYFGDYIEHTRQMLEEAASILGESQVISIQFEDLVDRKIESIKRISKFLFPDLSLPDKKANLIVKSTEFDRMKQEITENPQSFHFNPDKFFREGTAMGWKNSLSKAQQDRIFSGAIEKWPAIEKYYQTM